MQALRSDLSSTLHIVFSVASELCNALPFFFTLNVIVYQVKMLLFDNVQLVEQLWAFHTRAKSRDHEIVRGQKKASKGRSKTSSKSCNVITHPQV